MEAKIEEWRTVPNWDLYEVSSFGRVKGKRRLIRRGKNEYIREEKILKPQKDKHGYYCIWLKQDGKVKNAKVHRLVCEAFIPNPKGKPCVNHKDNNPSNNHVENLEWVTMQENTDWMIKQGRFKRTKEWLDNLHNTQRERFYKRVKGINIKTGETIYFESVNSVAKKGFQPSCVSNCCNGKAATHKGYKWEFA